MKYLNSIILAAVASAAALACVSCGNAEREIAIEHKSLADSSQYARLSMDIELPSDIKGVSGAIRSQLAEVVYDRMSQLSFEGNEKAYEPFSGDAADTDAMLGYFCSQTMKVLKEMTDADVASRNEYIAQDPDMTEEQKKEIMEEYPGWEYDYSIKKIGESPRYVVFLSQDYLYSGGAHGGVAGKGPLTFDKKDGHLVNQFFRPDCLEGMQPVLVAGLLRYYKECEVEMTESELKDHLFIEDNTIPLPSWAPYPTEEGLVFTYQQYEIASYAEGMPAFTVPYDQIGGFLTDEALTLLGL